MSHEPEEAHKAEKGMHALSTYRRVMKLEDFSWGEELADKEEQRLAFLHQFEQPGKPLLFNAKDGTLLGLVPEGQFLAGKEKFPVTLPAYYLALHPVTYEQYERFVDERNHRPPNMAHRGNSVWQGKHFPAQVEDIPVLGMCWQNAKEYCAWAGLRLPSELEWEKGARGVDGQEYPWGNGMTWNMCQNGLSNGMASGVWDYPGGCSPWGHYQMAGNIWEWCAEWYDRHAYDRYKGGDITPPASGSERVIRGGSWLDSNEDYFQCAYRNSRDPADRSLNFGFRCARNFTL